MSSSNAPIHPLLFNALFPTSNSNSIETPKFSFHAAALSRENDNNNNDTTAEASTLHDKPSFHVKFSYANCHVYAINQQVHQLSLTTQEKNNPQAALKSTALHMGSPSVSMESPQFLYRGPITNGVRHSADERSPANMLAKCPSLSLQAPDFVNLDHHLPAATSETSQTDSNTDNLFSPSSLQNLNLLVKFYTPFQDGLMKGQDCTVEWYQLPQGSSWEKDIVPWWQQNMRDLSATNPQELDQRITQFLQEKAKCFLKAVYKGSLLNGLKHGNGTMKWMETGDRYEGEFQHGKRHGTGVMEWATKAERYEGQWYEGLPHGTGSLYFFNVQAGSCNYYAGQFKNGVREGKGVFYYSDGTKFDGEWSRDQKNGYGEFHYMNGVVERGYYENDRKVRDVSQSSLNGGVQTPGSPVSEYPAGALSERSRPSSRGSSAPGTPKARPRSSSGRSVTSATSRARSGSTRKRSLASRKSSRLKNRRAAKELQAVNNQQFDNIPFYIDDLLMHTDYEQSELSALWSVLTRYAPRLQEIYNFYSLHGTRAEQIRIASTGVNHSENKESASSPNGTTSSSSPSAAPLQVKKVQAKFSKQNDLSLHQFWRFARDCGLVSLNQLSLAAIDRIFMKTSQISSRPDIRNVFQAGSAPRLSVLVKHSKSTNIHSPQNKIRFREFCEALFRISYSMYHSFDRKQHVPLNERFQNTLEQIVFPNFERVEESSGSGFLRDDARFAPVLSQYQEECMHLFREYATLQSHNIRDASLFEENDATITVRQFLRLLDTKNFIDPSKLSLMDVMNLLDRSNEETDEGAQGLSDGKALLVDRELIFEEFMEYLLQCALKKYEGDGPEEESVKKAFEQLFGDGDSSEESSTSEKAEE